MCGIFGTIGKKQNAKDIVLSGLKNLEYRGYDSWGIAVSDLKSKPRQIVVKKQVGKIGNATVSDLPQSNFALGHTRWATHGGVSIKNAHPHLDCSSNLALIHNGIIENYSGIKKDLITKGHKFVSETDTEVAVHKIEEYYQNLQRDNKKPEAIAGGNLTIEALRLAFNGFEGLNAIIVMDIKSQVFAAAKNGSPLVIGRGKEGNFLASDAHAILPYCRDIYFMEDGELILVSAKDIVVYEAKSGERKGVKFSRITWDWQSSSLGKYPHFMLKEIYEQKKVIDNLTSCTNNQVIKLTKLIQESYGAYLVGCGTAAYACLAGTYIFSKVAKRHINNSIASEFSYSLDFLTDKSLVIALSQSGETIDVIEAVKRAKFKGAKIACLVNVLGSTLYRIADYKLLLEAGVEKAVVSTKAFTAKLANLILTAYALRTDLALGRKVMKQTSYAITEVFTRDNIQKIKLLARYLYRKQHVYIIGRGLSYPVALEIALKIKEASYIHAEGFAAGELKHGAIALVEKDTPAIAILANDETYGSTLAGAMEMKARGGYIIGISHKNHEIFDYYLPVKDCGVGAIIPSVITGQLLGYFLAVKRGFDPDKPRNLAKSVTVK